MGQSHDFIQRIGRILRAADPTAEQALPQRWVDLIHYLDEKEQREERERHRNARQRPN